MPSSPRKKWITGSCAGLVVALALGGFWATRTHGLLDHATRITENSFTGYAWESAEKLILLLPPSDTQGRSFVERNITTGAQTLGAFASSLSDATGWRPSPDGQRLLVCESGSDFSSMGLRETERTPRTFSSNTYETESTSASGVAWLSDNRRWLGWTPAQTMAPLHLYSVDAPRDSGVVIPSPKGMKMLLGVTPEGLAVQTDAPSPPAVAERVTISTFGIYPNRAAVKSVSVSLPVTTQIKELELSPKGNRLAWLLIDSRRPPFLRMLVRAVPSLAGRFPPTLGSSLWVSRLDGTEMAEVGFEQTLVAAKNTHIPSELRWLPDGKHLSFRMNDALYTIPAP